MVGRSDDTATLSGLGFLNMALKLSGSSKIVTPKEYLKALEGASDEKDCKAAAEKVAAGIMGCEKLAGPRKSVPEVQRKNVLSKTTPTLPKVEEPLEGMSWNGPGMYLVYEPSQNGILFMVYSKTPVAKAIAYGKPGKSIPAFKFNTLGGRTELVKGASDKATFMRGVAAFIKQTRLHSADVDVSEAAGLFPFAAYIHSSAGKVSRVKPGFLTSTEGLDAVACVPQANADFKGISLLDKALFIQRGDAAGGSAS
eukprot:TRINITY_DN1364_c4_g1_i1.p1 TRINITY_DN1364_c4_g1~~TRINITY_DN1364_c4_g1_i1.p1  ORF type:complete len:275 (+),score=54.20 TRINITY_DN1364_c4_g1_i1:65-826(+)